MFTIPVSAKGWHCVACNCAEEKSFRKMLTFSPAQLTLLLKQMLKTLPKMCLKVHLPPDFSQEAASSQKLCPSSEFLSIFLGLSAESHPQMFHGSQLCPPGLAGRTKPKSLLLHESSTPLSTALDLWEGIFCLFTLFKDSWYTILYGLY